MGRPGYMNVKEAARHYGVSRAKLHRLIRQGRLRTAKDPRDERVTLLRTEDLEALFKFHQESVSRGAGQKGEGPATQPPARRPGQITQELVDRLNALRKRIAAEMGGIQDQDSVEILREQRELRSKQLYEAAFGKPEQEGPGDRRN